MTFKHFSQIAASAAGVALLVAGCAQTPAADTTPGAGTAPGAEGDVVTTPAADSANAADVEFTQGMIPHHVQALEMSELAPSRSSDPEVLALAKQIQAAQDPEIQTMTRWLEGWGEEVPDTTDMDHDAMDHGDHGGMMTAAEMEELEAASGTEFDRLFLELMIVHHEGAVVSAENVIAWGDSDEVRDLAEEIIAGQTAEIDHMRALLAGLDQ